MASNIPCSTADLSYDVFLSFRGEDTRRNFTDHLYTSLTAYGIHTFRDSEELHKGEDIASELSRLIQKSRMFIIVFSRNYASSKWCLNELVKIIELMKQKRSTTILPVFYHVDPSEVRYQSGSYGEEFSKYEKDAGLKMENIEKWRAALAEAANLDGWHVDEQYETEVVNEITNDIIRRLNREPLNMGKNIVGVSLRLEKLKSLMNTESNEVCVVGIYGIGGIGKTTIAKAIYNDISYKFHGSCFLRNVRERSKDDTLQLQQELLHGILRGKSLKVSNIDEGLNMIKNCLKSKKLLVVFDDVDNLKQLKYLVEEPEWFSTKSIVIITTRDKHILTQYGKHVLYEVEKLNDDEAIELFSRWAFKQNMPQETYGNLSYQVIEYAKGLPLALEVLGSLFLGKKRSEWKSALHKLEKIPHMEIQNVLKISYDGLDDKEKEIFLDIACFFKGQDKDFVSRILHKVHAEHGIRVLHDKGLITISENKLDMHNLIQQMGHEIVRQECPKEPGKWSRLWDTEDVYRVVTKNMGTETVEGIILGISASEQIQISAEAFKMMIRLRLLIVHNSMVEHHSVGNQVQLYKIHLPADFQIPSYELIFLHWDGYSLESLPSNFQADNLVELRLRCSNIKQLCKGDMIFNELKVIDLSFSEHLIIIPDITSVPNLEILILEGCTNLMSLPSKIYKLKGLRTLCCRECLKLTSFPEIKERMKNLRELYLSDTAIKELSSSSTKHLKGLTDLDLTGCRKLVHVPKSICSLRSLKVLSFSYCRKLDKLPEDLDCLPCLESLSMDCLRCELPCLSSLSSLKELSLDQSNITPEVIPSDRLSSLKSLSLNYNRMKRGILDNIFSLSSLEKLELRGNNFSSIPASISKLPRLRSLNLSHCKRLLQIPELPSSLRVLDTHNSPVTLSGPWSLLKCFKSAIQETDCDFTKVEFIPGDSGIPQWIDGFQKGNYAAIILPQNWYHNNMFLGFAIGCVYVLLDDESNCESEYSSENESRHTSSESDNSSGNESGHTSDKSDYSSKNEESQKKSALTSHNLECYLFMEGKDNDDVRDLEHLTFPFDCECYEDDEDEVSDQMWVMYYPKVAIPEIFHSNQWTSLRTSLEGYTRFGKTLQIKECVIDIIYDLAHQNRDLTGTFRDHGYSCSDCQLDMECKLKLCLEGNEFYELPTIEHPLALDSLCLRNCENLKSLPSDICKLKSLTSLFCSGCSELKSFPEIMENMDKLRKLYLNQTAIQELPSSIDHLQGLQYLSVESCDNFLSLPDSICNLRYLKVLVVDCCPNLHKLPENLGSLQSLEELYAAYSYSIGCQLPSLSGLCSLRILDIHNSKLSHGAIPRDICCLYSLKLLNLRNCNLIEGGIPSEIYNLSSLQELRLGGNHFSSLPDGMNKLSSLRVLDLSHCQKLKRIPDFSPSLQVLDTHSCASLETLSSPSDPLRFRLLKCFKSLIQDLELGNDIPIEPHVAPYLDNGISIAIPRSSGISEWMRYQKCGSKVTTKLPRNWYKNTDFLGFALFSIHVPVDHESDDLFDDQETPNLESEEDETDNQETPSSEGDGIDSQRNPRSESDDLFDDQETPNSESEEDETDNQETLRSESDNESEGDGIDSQRNPRSESDDLFDDQETPNSESEEDETDKQETPCSESDNVSEEDGIDCQQIPRSESDNESEDDLDNKHTWSLECELTIGDDHQFWFKDHISFQCYCECDIGDDISQVWVTYCPKIIIPKKHASNKSRHLKASFEGFFCGEPVEVEKCGIQLIYAQEDEQKIISRQDDAKRSCGDAKDNPADEPHRKRFKPPNTDLNIEAQ